MKHIEDFFNEAQQYSEILKRYKENGEVFTDPNFHPNCEIKELKFSFDKERYKWCRIDEFYPAPLFKKELISDDSILQGDLDDSYLIASLIRIAKQPNLVEKLFDTRTIQSEIDTINLKCGAVIIYFHVFGKLTPVLIDTLIPFQRGTRIPVFSRPKNNKYSAWFCLVEKAYAKLQGSYSSITDGTLPQAIYHLFGYYYPYIYSVNDLLEKREKQSKLNTTNDMNDENEYLFSHLMKWQYENSVIGSIINTDQMKNNDITEDEIKDNGLVTSQTYLIQKVRREDGINFICLRNPKNDHEWLGEWSNSSNSWTCDMKRKLGFHQQNNGTFWMNDKDFFKYFTTFYVSKTVNTENHTKSVKTVPDSSQTFSIKIKDDCLTTENPVSTVSDVKFHLTVERRFSSEKLNSSIQILIVYSNGNKVESTEVDSYNHQSFTADSSLSSFTFNLLQNEPFIVLFVKESEEEVYATFSCNYDFDLFDIDSPEQLAEEDEKTKVDVFINESKRYADISRKTPSQKAENDFYKHLTPRTDSSNESGLYEYEISDDETSSDFEKYAVLTQKYFGSRPEQMTVNELAERSLSKLNEFDNFAQRLCETIGAYQEEDNLSSILSTVQQKMGSIGLLQKENETLKNTCKEIEKRIQKQSAKSSDCLTEEDINSYVETDVHEIENETSDAVKTVEQVSDFSESILSRNGELLPSNLFPEEEEAQKQQQQKEEQMFSNNEANEQESNLKENMKQDELINNENENEQSFPFAEEIEVKQEEGEDEKEVDLIPEEKDTSTNEVESNQFLSTEEDKIYSNISEVNASNEPSNEESQVEVVINADNQFQQRSDSQLQIEIEEEEENEFEQQNAEEETQDEKEANLFDSSENKNMILNENERIEINTESGNENQIDHESENKFDQKIESQSEFGNQEESEYQIQTQPEPIYDEQNKDEIEIKPESETKSEEETKHESENILGSEPKSETLNKLESEIKSESESKFESEIKSTNAIQSESETKQENETKSDNENKFDIDNKSESSIQNKPNQSDPIKTQDEQKTQSSSSTSKKPSKRVDRKPRPNGKTHSDYQLKKKRALQTEKDESSLVEPPSKAYSELDELQIRKTNSSTRKRNSSQIVRINHAKNCPEEQLRKSSSSSRRKGSPIYSNIVEENGAKNEKQPQKHSEFEFEDERESAKIWKVTPSNNPSQPCTLTLEDTPPNFKRKQRSSSAVKSGLSGQKQTKKKSLLSTDEIPTDSESQRPPSSRRKLSLSPALVKEYESPKRTENGKEKPKMKITISHKQEDPEVFITSDSISISDKKHQKIKSRNPSYSSHKQQQTESKTKPTETTEKTKSHTEKVHKDKSNEKVNNEKVHKDKSIEKVNNEKVHKDKSIEKAHKDKNIEKVNNEKVHKDKSIEKVHKNRSIEKVNRERDEDKVKKKSASRKDGDKRRCSSVKSHDPRRQSSSSRSDAVVFEEPSKPIRINKSNLNRNKESDEIPPNYASYKCQEKMNQRRKRRAAAEAAAAADYDDEFRVTEADLDTRTKYWDRKLSNERAYFNMKIGGEDPFLFNVNSSSRWNRANSVCSHTRSFIPKQQTFMEKYNLQDCQLNCSYLPKSMNYF